MAYKFDSRPCLITRSRLGYWFSSGLELQVSPPMALNNCLQYKPLQDAGKLCDCILRASQTQGALLLPAESAADGTQCMRQLLTYVPASGVQYPCNLQSLKPIHTTQPQTQQCQCSCRAWWPVGRTGRRHRQEQSLFSAIADNCQSCSTCRPLHDWQAWAYELAAVAVGTCHRLAWCLISGGTTGGTSS